MTNNRLTYTTPDRLVLDFACRGLVVLAPEILGIPASVHEEVYAQEKKVHGKGVRVTPANVPAVLDLLNAPGLVDACDQLVGRNWAIVPFTHNASFTSGARDQHWHKDDNGPYNSRKVRHHQAVQIEMLYYPQAVTELMGPTATVPYSQYWTFNHEENHDNFAGADHLDFAFALSGMEREPISGPDSKYKRADILHARTAHDIRMREAVTNTGWPLVHEFAAAPLRAGSVILYSHNTFHRGNHRRDNWRTWRKNPRFMWRFWLYRTTDVEPGSRTTRTRSSISIRWNKLGVDPMTRVDLSKASDDVTSVWRYHHHWINTNQPPPAPAEAARLTPKARKTEAEALYAQLHATGEVTEPIRIGAAYKLASIGDAKLAARLLGKALYTDRESVRRAATYGLVAVGDAATATLLKAAASEVKWVRKAGVYGLGDASALTPAVLKAVVTRLLDDSSVYIRSVAAGSLGCLARRAIATGVGIKLVPNCMDALLQSLSCEENRLSMSKAQGRSIKYVRPTDECDVCEGDGVTFDLERYQPVRSAVRENALWSIVMLCSHGPSVLGSVLEPAIAALQEVVRADANVISVGYAMDALARLANAQMDSAAPPPTVTELRAELREILSQSPVQCWESLVRAGVTP
jgi:Phytanoyl-CoA dioxygenase (PhyH)